MLLALFLCFFLTGERGHVFGQDIQEDFPPLLTDREIYSEWIIYINVRAQKEFLNYKDNTLKPLSEVRIFTKRRDPRTGQWEQRRHYESLWYANGNPIGCRRFQPLPLRPQGSVVMIVEPTKDVPEFTKSCANAVIRLLMDIHVVGGILERVYVQRDLCEKMTSDFGVMKFFGKGST